MGNSLETWARSSSGELVLACAQRHSVVKCEAPPEASVSLKPVVSGQQYACTRKRP